MLKSQIPGSPRLRDQVDSLRKRKMGNIESSSLTDRSETGVDICFSFLDARFIEKGNSKGRPCQHSDFTMDIHKQLTVVQ